MIRQIPLPNVRDLSKTTNKPLTFGGGINNTDPEQKVGREQIVSGRNMWLDREGGAYNRLGELLYGNIMGVTTGILGLWGFVKNDGSTSALLAAYDTVIKYYNSGTWTDISGITLTTNLKAEGTFYSETNKFYITNGTDDVGVITTTGSATTDANFKKGIWIEDFDGRLMTGGVGSQENRVWVTDLGVDTFTSTNYWELDGKSLAGKELQRRLALLWTDRKLYLLPGIVSTPNASGPEALHTIDDVGIVGTRAVTVLTGVAYYVGLDSQNTLDVFACDGQRNIRIGSDSIKDYLQGLAPGQLSNLCMTNDGRNVRFAAAPSGATTNTREYCYDTLRKVWQPEFRSGFPISCYATFKISNQNYVVAGHQSIGAVYQLGTGRYDELIDQSYTAGQDADEQLAGATTTRVAQSFELSASAGETRYITKLALLLKKVSGTTTQMTVRIETDSSNKPSGTLVDANATTTISALTSTSYAWTMASFATPFTVTGDTKYWIVLKHTTEGSGDSIHAWGSDSSSPSYGNGSAANYASSTWTADATTDCLFMLFIEEPIEAFVCQTTDLDNRLYPKKVQQVLIEGQSSTGVIAKLGFGVEGKDSSFEESDIPLFGKGSIWSTSTTDTATGHLVWAVDSEQQQTTENIKWASGITTYSPTVFPPSYVPHARYITYRFYYKGIGEFRINSYTPYFELIPSTV